MDAARASGQRTVPVGGAAAAEGLLPVATEVPQTSGGSVAGDAATPVPTNPADNGVQVEIVPTPTPDTAPVNAAPAVAGASIVIGLSSLGVNGPATIRSGEQTWEMVNTGDEARIVAVYPGTDLAPDLDGAVMTSAAIDPQRSETIVASMTDGTYVLVSWPVGQEGPDFENEATVFSLLDVVT